MWKVAGKCSLPIQGGLLDLANQVPLIDRWDIPLGYLDALINLDGLPGIPLANKIRGALTLWLKLWQATNGHTIKTYCIIVLYILSVVSRY